MYLQVEFRIYAFKYLQFINPRKEPERRLSIAWPIKCKQSLHFDKSMIGLIILFLVWSRLYSQQSLRN